MGFVDMGHPVPGSIGLVVRMSVLYINLVTYEAKTRIRKNTLRCKANQELIRKVPNLRLHISGEKYVH